MTENTIKVDKQADKPQSGKKKNQTVLIIILFLICGVLTWQVVSLKHQMKDLMGTNEVLEVKKTELTSELDILMLEYDSIKMQYGELADSLMMQDSVIQASVKEIQKLLASQSDYRRVKRKLKYLRGITQSYVSQLDSLFTVSGELQEENVHLTANLRSERKKTSELSEAKDDLTKKVAEGSILQIYNINPTSLRKKGSNKEVETDKAKKVDKINVCFTIGKNTIVESGKKNVYLRISGPDDKILIKGAGDEHSFLDNSGSQLQYSVKQEVDYKNRNLDVCTFWSQGDEFSSGMYVASIFIEGELVGESSFSLR